MSKILGLDIGGANTKYALVESTNNEIKLIQTGSDYFPFWKKHIEYTIYLRELKDKLEHSFGGISRVVFVTTAELADCFQTKEEGIVQIANFVMEVFSENGRPLIYDVEGNFIEAQEAKDHWLQVSASNWFASAQYLAKKYKDAILIDIGSTTTDIIPIFNNAVVAQGKTDIERLTSRELVYTGLLRTNVATILPKVKINLQEIPLSSELFATTGDVHLILGNISEKEFTVETTDGKDVSKINSLVRLARIVCADVNQLSEKELTSIAKQIEKRQFEILSEALNHVLENYYRNYEVKPQIILIGSAINALGIPLLRMNGIYDEIIVSDILSREELNVFSAFAIATLYIKEFNDK
ncbi:MAG: H4MPT-linked C1 transfer pathway protein [Asgard group archaeon]|nr:H4MPT-linked C1 transfer pathway protein [Asgard group archaeon]